MDRVVKFLGHVNITALDLIMSALAVPLTVAYFFTKHWMLNNVLAAAFCVNTLARLTIGRYRTGVIALAGLFVYDIVMVFYTPMMVAVATKLDGPIKLIFPRGFNDASGAPAMGLLGLGDLIVPGIFLTQLLRKDAEAFLERYIAADAAAKKDAPQALQSAQSASVDDANGDAADPAPIIDADELPHMEFAKPLYQATWAAYSAGLVATIIVMHVWQHAQPALLYLVPAVVLASMLTAVVRGEFMSLWRFTEQAYLDVFQETTGRRPRVAPGQVEAAGTQPAAAAQ